MKHLLLTVLGAFIANVASWILYQGFIQSYFGKNSREEITRIFNQLSKHYKKANK
jgi:uncharacterized protein YggT (Ycf19 family)